MFNIFDFSNLGGNQLGKAVSNQKLPTVAPFNPWVQLTYSPTPKTTVWGEQQINTMNAPQSGIYNSLYNVGSNIADWATGFKTDVAKEERGGGMSNLQMIDIITEMKKDGLSKDEMATYLQAVDEKLKSEYRANQQKAREQSTWLRSVAWKTLELWAGNLQTLWQYGGNVLDFATLGKTGIGEDVKQMTEYNKEAFGDSNYFKAGTYLPDVALGISPLGAWYMAWAKWAWQVALRSGVVGAWFWATQPILEKWNEATMWDIATWAAIGGTLWAAIPLAWAWIVKWAKWVKSIITPKTAEQKILESVWPITKWIVQWKTVKVPVPEKWIIEKVTFWIGRNKDAKVLAWRALTPSYAGKTPKQMLKTVWDIESNVKEFYSQIRTWKMKWDISTLENAANSVVSNLDEIGSKIWWAVETAKWRTAISMWTRAEMKRALTNKIEKRAWAYAPLNNFYKDTSKWLSLKDAFKAKKVYQSEITKLIKSWDAWTDSYQALVKWVQELSDNIDNAVEKSIWTKEFLQWKKQYKLLKSIASDLSKSAVVEWRRSPNTFVEQLWTLEAIKEWITSPLSTAWKLYAKEIGELNTRWWAWKELIKIYDQQAINLSNKTQKTIKKSPTVTVKTIKKPRNITNWK